MPSGPETQACAGWDGDRLQAYAVPGAEWAALVWALTFDSERDAAEFARALDRHRQGGPAPIAGATVSVDGADVLLIGGVAKDRVEAVRAAALAGLERDP